jgi:hypothetical protein
MSVDTVTLNRKDYDDLRDFKIEIERGNSLWIAPYGFKYLVISETELAADFKKEQGQLEESIRNLKKQLDPKNQESAETIETLRRKSLLSVIKWKLKNN